MHIHTITGKCKYAAAHEEYALLDSDSMTSKGDKECHHLSKIDFPGIVHEGST